MPTGVEEATEEAVEAVEQLPPPYRPVGAAVAVLVVAAVAIWWLIGGGEGGGEDANPCPPAIQLTQQIPMPAMTWPSEPLCKAASDNACMAALPTAQGQLQFQCYTYCAPQDKCRGIARNVSQMSTGAGCSQTIPDLWQTQCTPVTGLCECTPL